MEFIGDGQFGSSGLLGWSRSVRGLVRPYFILGLGKYSPSRVLDPGPQGCQRGSSLLCLSDYSFLSSWSVPQVPCFLSLPPSSSLCMPSTCSCVSCPTVHPRMAFSFFLLFRIPTLSCKPPKGLHYWKEQYCPPAGFQIPTLLFTSYATLGEIVQFLCASVSSSVMEVRPYGQNEISVVKEPFTASRPCVQGGVGSPFLCPPSLQRELAQTE